VHLAYICNNVKLTILETKFVFTLYTRMGNIL